MTEAFSFNAYDIGQTSQHIMFRPTGGQEVRYDIPGMQLPEDQAERFWVLYNKLVELGAIPNRTPTFN